MKKIVINYRELVEQALREACEYENCSDYGATIEWSISSDGEMEMYYRPSSVEFWHAYYPIYSVEINDMYEFYRNTLIESFRALEGFSDDEKDNIIGQGDEAIFEALGCDRDDIIDANIDFILNDGFNSQTFEEIRETELGLKEFAEEHGFEIEFEY